MSEFSKLTTKLVTPLLKQHGFKKHGPFDRSALHDFALYRKDKLEVKLTFSLHPYDYSEHGIKLEIVEANRVLLQHLSSPRKGGIQSMLNETVELLKTSPALGVYK